MMHIEIKITGKYVLLRLSGRLDVVWAEHFFSEAQEIIRSGRHNLLVDAAGLDYISSAGIRALIKVSRELAGVSGTFLIVNPSSFVEKTLSMSGLDKLIASPTETELLQAVEDERSIERDQSNVSPAQGMEVDVFEIDASAFMRGRAPCSWRPWAPVRDNDVVKLSFPKDTVALGIGAPGTRADDARNQFGEFLAVSGCLTWLPAGGNNVPDYLIQSERFVPELYAIQAMTAQGGYSHLIRFRARDKTDAVTLSELSANALNAVGAESVVMVCLAEIEGLVGAALSRSPCGIRPEDQPGRFPDIRDWLAFCGERVHARQSVLVAAFAARNTDFNPALSALPSDPSLFLHAHAAVMPYRHLQEGVIQLHETVNAFFETAGPVDLMHLLEDNRPGVGLGQSAFVRGACWCAPLRYEQECKL